MPRFRNIEEKHPDFLRGFGFQGGSSMEKWGHAFALPGFGAAFKQQVRDDRPWNMNFSGFGECLGRYENFCEIDKDEGRLLGHPGAAHQHGPLGQREEDDQGHGATRPRRCCAPWAPRT